MWGKPKRCRFRHSTPIDDTICAILREFKRIAVVGLSDDPWRDSNYAAGYLLQKGYCVLPVNPNISEVFGLKAYPDLLSTPKPVDVVEVFRRPESIAETVNHAIEIGAKAVWIEGGFVDEAWAAPARQAGLRVIMDRCMIVEHDKHMGGQA